MRRPEGRRSTAGDRGQLADPDFEALYQDQLESLRASLYESGAGQDILDARVELLKEQATHLVDEATIAEEADAIAGATAG